MVASMDLKVNHLLHEVSKNQENSRLIFEMFDARQKAMTVEQWLQIYKKVCSIKISALFSATIRSILHVKYKICINIYVI